MIKLSKNSKTIAFSGSDLKALMTDDYALVRDLSPYANWTENDVMNSLDDATLINLINGASYARKAISISLDRYSITRPELLDLYHKCRKFATESIINSLYPVDRLTMPVQHLDCAKDKFYILSRVRTKHERPTVNETADARTYLSYTLASHLNLSHYPGSVWYGYRAGITPDMIGLILSYDADTRSWARNRRELGAQREELLDAKDLVAASLRRKTYSQISIKTKIPCAPALAGFMPITSNCILCINNIDDISKRASDKEKLPILVLHPSKQTFCRIHDYCKSES